MLLERERALVARCASRLARDGLVVGSAGNVSLRSGSLIAITPTSVDYDELDEEGVVVVDTTGARIAGARTPSSELPMHLGVYAVLGAGAIVHTHSPCATALATARLELPPIHYLAADLGGRVRLAPYATFGTDELAAGVVAALHGRNAVLLERHGTLTIGDTLDEAYVRARSLEWLAALYIRASALGPLHELDEAELSAVRARLEALRSSAQPPRRRQRATMRAASTRPKGAPAIGAAAPTSARRTSPGESVGAD